MNVRMVTFVNTSASTVMDHSSVNVELTTQRRKITEAVLVRPWRCSFFFLLLTTDLICICVLITNVKEYAWIKIDVHCVHLIYAGTPTNVSLATTSSHSLTMSWNSPTYLEDRHGSFIAYIVKCQSERGEIYNYSFGNVTLVTMDRLLPFQLYNCCVSLQTAMANSTETCQQQRTAEDGKHL